MLSWIITAVCGCGPPFEYQPRRALLKPGANTRRHLPPPGPPKYTAHVPLPQPPAPIATFEGTTRDTFKRPPRSSSSATSPTFQWPSASSGASSPREIGWPSSASPSPPPRHRPVGEASVFVAASAVHKVRLARACRFVIDEVKGVGADLEEGGLRRTGRFEGEQGFFERGHGKLSAGAEQDKGFGGKEADGDEEDLYSR
ncbi:uncharacterized protein A4U43_C01F35500 [Asparagus officinalis]|uniref:Uncharacterized protein n=1 Tax=Asparagus officinalis TaxID=4686 RepID=A0A5P1FX49_ASPOF|nr:uncharacterized protein A4U43_C01F35500 [Asparagus officinalis]